MAYFTFRYDKVFLMIHRIILRVLNPDPETFRHITVKSIVPSDKNKSNQINLKFESSHMNNLVLKRTNLKLGRM